MKFIENLPQGQEKSEKKLHVTIPTVGKEYLDEFCFVLNILFLISASIILVFFETRLSN